MQILLKLYPPFPKVVFFLDRFRPRIKCTFRKNLLSLKQMVKNDLRIGHYFWKLGRKSAQKDTTFGNAGYFKKIEPVPAHVLI